MNTRSPLLVTAWLTSACLEAPRDITFDDVADDVVDSPIDPGATVDEPPAQADAWGPVLPRLTVPQVQAALEQLFERRLATPVLEPDTDPFFFSRIGASTTTLSESGVQQLEEAIDGLTRRVFADPAWRVELLGCEPTGPGDDCVEAFLDDFGRRAWRRPLTALELLDHVNLSKDLSEGDAWLGVQAAVSSLLQGPWFVYRVELGTPDPAHATLRVLSGYELASRLAFTLWNRPPDAALLDAASKGELADAEGIEGQARRMLQAPAARTAVQDFFTEYLDLDRLASVQRSAEVYPDFTPTLAAAMATEVRLIVDDLVFRRKTDLRKLWSTQRTFVNAELAAHYELDAPDATDIAFAAVDLPSDGPRGGVLTLGAFLTLNAHAVTTSPTLRGAFLRARLLCEEVPPPPPNVSTELADDSTGPKTVRQRLEEHRTNPACSGCHRLMDPPGLLFENFDATGAWRTLDNGLPIDASGDLDGAPLDSAKALGTLLTTDDRVSACLVKHLYRYTQSRLDHPADEPVLADLSRDFSASGYRFDELLVALVTHDSFRHVGDLEEAP